MTIRRLITSLIAPLIAVFALTASASAPLPNASAPSPNASAPTPNASAPAPNTPSPAPAAPARPALWKIADHDTTIYLFGTIHLLPRGVDWLHGPVANAFDHADELMTELPDLPPAEVAAAVLKYGALPAGQNLRAMLTPAQRGQLEAALTALGVPLAYFDDKKPWVAAATIPILQLQHAGYNVASGVEHGLDQRNAVLRHKRSGLETIAFQFGVFDSLSQPQQIEYLGAVLDALPQIDGEIRQMVAHWSRGDAAALAAQLNADQDSPQLAEALIFSRNRTWAGWIERRMKQPGTVFIAVGAGHLGGRGSVQEVLAKHGFKAARVQ